MVRRGTSIAGDPQLGLDIPYPPVASVRELADGDTVRVGRIVSSDRSSFTRSASSTTVKIPPMGMLIRLSLHA